MKRTLMPIMVFLPTILILTISSCGQGSSGGAVPPGSVDLSWTPPTRNTDSSAIGQGELGGYLVYYGREPGAYISAAVITDPAAAASSCTIDALTLERWYFAVKAFNIHGNDSDFSDEISEMITIRE